VLSCLLALGCKEVAISAPLVVLLYDRAFLGGTFREAWRRRWPLYVGLLGAWLAFALLLLYSGSRGTWAGYGLRTSWQEYALSQFGVIVHYLRLSLWPSPLVLDYGWPVPRTVGAILPAALVVAMLLAATVYGLVRWPRWGFLGACFFLILAPTSTILPLNCLSCEYRMYLPLAAAVAAVVLGGYLGCARLLLLPSRSGRRAVSRGWAMPWAVPAATLAAVALALGYATRQRNGDYRSLLVIWQDTVEKRPQNFHARTDLGVALAAVGKTSEAIEHYQRSLQLQPDYADAHANLGNALARLGRTREAIEHYRIAVQVDPANALAHYNLGSVFASEGNLSEAIEHYQAALRLEPDDVKAHNDLGVALAAIGKIPEATEHYQQVLQRQPDHAEAHTNLGNVLARSGRIREAIEHYQTAVQLDPANALVHYNLGTAFLDEGNLSQAIEQYRKVLRLKADYAAAHYMLGSLLARVGRTKEAIEQYGQLLPSAPHFADAQHNLAWLLATCEPKDGGDAAGAVQLAERACQQDKQDSRDDPQRLDTLAAAYAAAGRFPEAVTTARQAIQLAESAGQTALAKEIQSRCELYRAGRPYRAAAAEHTH
jgi:tetratricopeptide (TPR) repeat protein